MFEPELFQAIVARAAMGRQSSPSPNPNPDPNRIAHDSEMAYIEGLVPCHAMPRACAMACIEGLVPWHAVADVLDMTPPCP